MGFFYKIFLSKNMRKVFLCAITILQCTLTYSQIPIDGTKIAGSYYAAIGKSDLTAIFGYAPKEKQMMSSFDQLGGGSRHTCIEIWDFKKDGVRFYANCEAQDKLVSVQLYKRSRFFLDDLGIRVNDEVTLEKLGIDEKIYLTGEKGSLMDSGVKRFGKIHAGTYTIYTDPLPPDQVNKSTILRIQYIELKLP
jgi:hypothetical protein